MISRLIKISIIAVFFSVILFSCGNDSPNSTSAKSLLFTSGGRTSEVLVIISDNLWKSAIGDSIKNSLAVVPEWLARAEPEYDLNQIPYNAFGSVYQKQRNILFVKLGDIPKPKISIRKDVYANLQTVVTIKAKDEKSLVFAFEKYKELIKTTYHNNEITRIRNAYKGMQVKKLNTKLDQKFGFHLIFPKGFYLAMDKADFAWLRRPTADIEEGVFIYTKPYSDTSEFSLQSIINYRNEMTKKYIPGPVDNSYMKASDFFPPIIKKTEFLGHYASQVRGLWDVEGYAMGGPFISYTFVDSVAQRLITIDGYIKAPKKEKRDLLLHIEAIMESFEYKSIEEKKQNTNDTDFVDNH